VGSGRAARRTTSPRPPAAGSRVGRVSGSSRCATRWSAEISASRLRWSRNYRGAGGVFGAGDQRAVGEPDPPLRDQLGDRQLNGRDAGREPPQPAVVLRLVGQAGKEAGQPEADQAEELAVRVDAHCRLRHRERDQLPVGDLPRRAAARNPQRIGEHVAAITRVSSEAVISCSNHEVAGLEALSLVPDRVRCS
jgi:hypothetical protein